MAFLELVGTEFKKKEKKKKAAKKAKEVAKSKR
jgi:hypothetical protein